MSIDYNQCQYLNAEKDNASSMLKKCINGNDDLAWPCISRELFDSNILNYNTERPNGDNVGVKLPHTLHNKVDDIDDYDTNNDKETNKKMYDDSHVEGFTNMGESYVKPGDLPDGYFRCPKSGKVKQVCMNCKYNQRTYGKSKEFNEGDYCFPNRGVYNGITNQGLTKCTCGSRGQYCGDNFNAQGGMFADNVFIMNVGNFGKLGTLAAY
jgi:hypothetical protein